MPTGADLIADIVMLAIKKLVEHPELTVFITWQRTVRSPGAAMLVMLPTLRVGMVRRWLWSL
ncbi:hypothetical protein U724_06915 [Pseudomonas chlororaphis subsp. aurantiaca PB-St2]|nr:hypothetical protein U724_06915 [Pseudomonas chlororaphis subsp. aurantiaca PB-St2]